MPKCLDDMLRGLSLPAKLMGLVAAIFLLVAAILQYELYFHQKEMSSSLVIYFNNVIPGLFLVGAMSGVVAALFIMLNPK